MFNDFASASSDSPSVTFVPWRADPFVVGTPASQGFQADLPSAGNLLPVITG
ncbi:Uncharacterized protein pbN1_08510 [Aromatoleum bremense]|nr:MULTISPECIES: hypothetical protein [Aromatoleum]MCK0509074.1 hypothetical protein [Aromatoleum anaerobium]QTQ30843.1 Uncharacterized protein pbN1_08510 [Aromatoleum bremense]